jgi:SAM-dependent methyltransferase
MNNADAKRRFSNRVADYVAGRPTYPLDLLKILHDRIGFTADWQVVDVGAGTGISSALFLGNGNAVTAVEPNAAMRAAADELFAEDANYDSVSAPAEATTLHDGSADLIVAAQAFHWFDHAAFARECRRLLSPRGRVLVMWNLYDPAATPAAAAYWNVIQKHSVDAEQIERKWRDGEAVAGRWFTPETFVRVDLPNPLSYDAEKLLLRLASSSYMPPRDHPSYPAMAADLRAAFDAHAVDGQFTLPNVCKVFVGVPRVG